MIVSAVAAPQGAERRRTEFGLPAGCDTFNSDSNSDCRRLVSGRLRSWELTYNSPMISRAVVVWSLALPRPPRWAWPRRRRARRARARFAAASGRRPHARVPAADHPSTTSRSRRWSCRSIRCRARSFRSSTSTAISRRRSRPQQFDTRRGVDGPAEPAGAGQRQRRVGRPAACRRVAALAASQHKDRMVHVHEHQLPRRRARASAQRAAQQLEADVKAGALGLGEITKGFGLRARKADGIAAEARRPRARSDLADGGAAEHPGASSTPPIRRSSSSRSTIDNERWLELALFRDRRYPRRPQFPSFEELMAERDRLFKRHPKTTFIAAHLGLARQRPGPAGQDVRRDAERLRRGRRGALRPRAAAAHRARLLRQVPGPRSCSARTATSPTSSRTSGGRSRPPTSTSTTTATTTRSGSCTASRCPTPCCGSCTTRTR